MSTSTRDSEGFVIPWVETQTVRLSMRETDKERQKSRLLFFSLLVHSLFVTPKGKNLWFVNALIAIRIPLDSLYRSDRIIFGWITEGRTHQQWHVPLLIRRRVVNEEWKINRICGILFCDQCDASYQTTSIVLLVRNRYKTAFHRLTSRLSYVLTDIDRHAAPSVCCTRRIDRETNQ